MPINTRVTIGEHFSSLPTKELKKAVLSRPVKPFTQGLIKELIAKRG